MKKPFIEYPCTWSYRVIGTDESVMVRKIPLKLSAVKHTVSPGNQSRKGNYISLNIDVIVTSESERMSIIPLLRSIPGVKMVL